MILDIALAKIFTGLAIVSLMFCVVSAFEGNIDNFFYGLCGIVVFANIATAYIRKLLRD
jgi:hypothetical protein